MKKKTAVKHAALFLSTLAIITLTACVNSVPKLEPQEIVSNLIQPPWAASNEAFHMHHEGKLEMTGSLLIWDESIAVEDLVQISLFSAAKRAQVVAFEREGLWLHDARAKLADKELQHKEQLAELQELLTSAYSSARNADPDAWQQLIAKRRTLATAQIKTEFDALAALDSNWDRAASEKLIHTYCDGKLFEYAVNPKLIQRAYKTQPTPHIICESYYQQLAAPCLKSGSESAGQETGERLQCVWQTLMATPTFNAYYPESDTLTALKTVVAERPAALAELILASHEDPSKGRYLRFYKRFGRIGFGDPSITIKPHKDMLKVIRLVEAIESKHQLDTPATLPEEQRLFPAPATSDAITAQRQRIITIMQVLAKSLDDTSISDYLFNEPIPAHPYIDLQSCISNLSSANKSSHACALEQLFTLVEALREDITPSKEQLDSIDALRNTIKSLAQKIKEWVETIAQRELEALTLYSEAVNATAKAVAADGVARALYSQAQLTINKSEKLLQISIRLTEMADVWYSACFDRINNEATDCPDLEENHAQDSSVFAIFYDHTEGRLDMHFNLADPTLLGLQLLSRGGLDRNADRASFCSITSDEFRGLTLETSLYANLYDEALEILSGGAEFRDADGKTIYTASLGFDRVVNF